MHKLTKAIAGAALTVGLLTSAQVAHADQITRDTNVNTPPPMPGVQALGCYGNTGPAGCGPGWIWNGVRCVPC